MGCAPVRRQITKKTLKKCSIFDHIQSNPNRLIQKTSKHDNNFFSRRTKHPINRQSIKSQQSNQCPSSYKPPLPQQNLKQKEINQKIEKKEKKNKKWKKKMIIIQVRPPRADGRGGGGGGGGGDGGGGGGGGSGGEKSRRRKRPPIISVVQHRNGREWEP